MTTQNINIDVKATVKKATAKIDNLNGKLARTQRIMAKATVESNRFTKTISRGLNASATEVVKFNGNMLSLLFFGMELKRIFGGALKSIFEGYKKIVPEGSKFNQLTTQLSANWEFFKFQLADALAQSPLFQKMIQFAVKLVQAFTRLPEGVKTFIGFLLIAGAVIGTILMFTGIWALGVGSLINLYGVLGTSIGKAAIAMRAFINTTAFLAIFALVAILWKLNEAMGIFHEHSDVGKKKWDSFKKTMISVVGSAFKPMLDAIGVIGEDLGSMNEIMIVVGAVFQNVLLGIGMMINALVPLIRTVVNMFSILIRTVVNAAKIIGNFFSFDFEGVKNNFKDMKSGIVQDIDDITDAWSRSQQNFGDLQASFVTGEDIQAALGDYRAGLAAEQASTPVAQEPAENKIVVVDGMADAVSQGLISQEQADLIGGLTPNPGR